MKIYVTPTAQHSASQHSHEEHNAVGTRDFSAKDIIHFHCSYWLRVPQDCKRCDAHIGHALKRGDDVEAKQKCARLHFTACFAAARTSRFLKSTRAIVAEFCRISRKPMFVKRETTALMISIIPIELTEKSTRIQMPLARREAFSMFDPSQSSVLPPSWRCQREGGFCTDRQSGWAPGEDGRPPNLPFFLENSI